VARDEPLGLEPVESPSAVRHVVELMSSRSEPNGLQVERLGAERLGRVGEKTRPRALERQIRPHDNPIAFSVMYNANNKMLCLVTALTIQVKI